MHTTTYIRNTLNFKVNRLKLSGQAHTLTSCMYLKSVEELSYPTERCHDKYFPWAGNKGSNQSAQHAVWSDP